jgi:hypothetical protein
MAIYLGDSGYIELKREGLNTSLQSLLNPDDVEPSRRRFSFDFDVNALITGDQIEILATDGGDLELVLGHNYPDGIWYCSVDAVGGVRLYLRYEDAINGEESQALELVKPTRDIPILVRTQNRQYRCLAQVTSYQLTTSRDQVDLTSLGEEFRTGYTSGLISGQGSIACNWDYQSSICDGFEEAEFGHYLAQLVLRTQQGAGFLGRFVIKGANSTAISGGGSSRQGEALWWEARCIITNVAMTFAPSEIVRSQVEFVTTGPVDLKFGTIPGYLLQESDDLILQEDGDGILLEA